MSIRLLPLIALTLALAGCGEEKQTAEQLRCGDSGTAFTMAKSLIQQRMSDRTIYFASREHTKIGKEPECIFRIGGSLWAGGDAGGYRDFNVTVQYRGKNYWAIDKLWIDRI
jgi:hypothetical protein